MSQQYDNFVAKLKAMQTKLKPQELVLEKYEEWKPHVINSLTAELVFAIIKSDTTTITKVHKEIEYVNELGKTIKTGLLE
jgi:asparagine synthetase B (glutamine-hydrolysing)